MIGLGHTEFVNLMDDNHTSMDKNAVPEDATVQAKGEERASWLPSKVSPFLHGSELS